MSVIASNKKAYFDYEIQDTIEVGIVLSGDEVKSIRAKQISLSDSYAIVQKGEMVLLNCYIAPYSHSYEKSDYSRRNRVLLLHRREINKLVGDISRKGLTLIPLKVYINERGMVKISLGIAKHKKSFDKKQVLKERDIKRETQRSVKQHFD